MSASAGLFAGPAPRVRTVPPSADLLSVLAEALLRAADRETDPFALADMLILVPTRRAARVLGERIAARAGRTLLLPTIRPLGDLEEEPEAWGPGHVLLSAGAPLEPLRRKLELAALLRAREAAEGGVASPAAALNAADELVRLLDAAAAADDPDWSHLPALVEDADLAGHWRRSAQFLEIITTYWPHRLAADGLMDPAQHRRSVHMALAHHWRAHPPRGHVVIAGSTGSLPGVRTLMSAVSQLARGAVVLPGLDLDLDEEAWSRVGPQHPQFALKRTLHDLALSRTEIAVLQGAEENAPSRARRLTMREALSPPETAADWLGRLEALGGAALAQTGAKGLTIYPCTTSEEEAAVCALLLREALEDPGKTAALITPSSDLARRVAAKLVRWNIAPLVSAPAPLSATPAGALLALLSSLARDDGDPVALADLMRRPTVAARLSLEARTTFEQTHLRGSRRHERLADLAPRDAVAAMLSAALAPLVALGAPCDLTAFATAIAHAVEALAGEGVEAVWDGPDGEAAARFLRRLIAEGGALGEGAPLQISTAFDALLATETVPPSADGTARALILGPIEARLLEADRVVLGGLNEGAWPQRPPEDGFLSRAMRVRLGLPDPEERIGLSAHDFFQAACRPEVFLTRAMRADGAPTVASRWLWRLETLLKGAGVSAALAPEADLRPVARALHRPTRGRKALAPPAPRPPATARLKRIGVTDAERLIRDPYAVYARRILGLRAMLAVGAGLQAAERGAEIHKVLETASRAAGDGTLPQADDLLAALTAALMSFGVRGAALAAERARLAAPTVAFARWLADRREEVAHTVLECAGELALDDGVTLIGRADRIDFYTDGSAEIVDIKTGRPATAAQASAGLAPQLPLEAAMLARGAFAGVAQARTRALSYWRFAANDCGPRALDLDVRAVQEQALTGLRSLMRAYRAPEQPFRSKPRPQFMSDYPEYDHFARRKEWADAQEEPE